MGDVEAPRGASAELPATAAKTRLLEEQVRIWGSKTTMRNLRGAAEKRRRKQKAARRRRRQGSLDELRAHAFGQAEGGGGGGGAHGGGGGGADEERGALGEDEERARVERSGDAGADGRDARERAGVSMQAAVTRAEEARRDGTGGAGQQAGGDQGGAGAQAGAAARQAADGYVADALARRGRARLRSLLATARARLEPRIRALREGARR